MRVIAGKHKGRLLANLKGDNVRPTSDRIRENVFNIIQDRVKEKDFLDLFAGTGAMGLEAISRGANVVFNDYCKDSVQLIKKNLATINERAEVFNCDYLTLLNLLKDKRFDLIYIDPPYTMDARPILALIKANKLLKDKGIAIYERNIQKSCDYSGYTLLDQRKYGNTAIDFLGIEDEKVFGNR